MTTTGYLKTTGFDEWFERLAQLGRDIEEAAAQAVLAGGEVLQAGMQDRAPVYAGRTRSDVIPGNLRDHIKIYGPEQDGNYVFVEVGVLHRRNLTDADTARYGNAQEYGWSGGKHAHPYVRPTLDSDRAKARRAMVAVLKRFLEG